nr:cytochrome c oxidase accessory protein CcoG [Xanthomonadaceae bacterium]
REQVCKYMCPYARFQSAMFDRNTLLIAYDPMRGEPRGPRKRGLPSVLERARGLLDPQTAYDYVFRATAHPTAADNRAQARGTINLLGTGEKPEPLPRFKPEELGDCIDCTICVQVCPTGIDIRNGLQYECIACGACIDACDEVMRKVGYPRGLIRYATQNSIDGKPSRILRPRVLVYGLVLLALCTVWVWGVTHRSELIAEVLRDRNALYQQLDDGRIENHYTLKLANKSQQPQVYRISLEPAGAGLQLAGRTEVAAGPEEVVPVPVTVTGQAGGAPRREIRFVIESQDGRERRIIESSFFGPTP